MTRRRRLLMVLAVALGLVPGACGGRDKGPEVVETSFRLGNGLEVDLVTGACGDRAAVVVLFGVGTDHDPGARSGMGLLAGRLLAAATAAREERRVDVGTGHTTYSVVVPASRALAEIDDVASWMGRLAVTDADVARERAELLAELAKRRGGDPASTAAAYAAESVRPSPGGGWRGGVAAELETIDAARVTAHWQAHMQPGNARLVVVGKLDVKQLRARVETAFASLPAGTPPVARDPAGSTVTGTLVMGDTPSAVAVAIPAPAPQAVGYPAFLVLAARLAGAGGRTWTASYDPLAGGDLLLVTGAVQAGERAEPAAERIRGEVAALLAEPLAPGDVTAARARFGTVLGVDALAPAACKKDPRALAVARARRAQLALDGPALVKALDATSQPQLAEAAALFDPKRTAAVIAGGAIH